MFEFCADPEKLEGAYWLACYLTTGKHLNLYWSVFTVLGLMLVTAPLALAFGFAGATAARSPILPLRWVGKSYVSIVRGVPDIAFFLFFVVALDQGFEWVRHQVLCPEWIDPIRQGNDFVVCKEAKLPLSSASSWVHKLYSLFLAMLTYAIVYGAFAASVIFGAMRSVPHAQMETAQAYGMSNRQAFWRILIPQMWMYALPGLSNLWVILIKATPLLFLLGVEDIVYWARELGGTKNPRFSAYPHGDWRVWYFFGLLVFYLAFTYYSERILARVNKRLSKGQNTLGTTS